MNLPNKISLLRMLLVIVMYFFVQSIYFPILFIITGLTDALDGFLARKLKQTTNLGTYLDSMADITYYLSIPVWLYMKYPEIFSIYYYHFISLAILYFLNPLVQLIIYRKIFFRHTWLAKTSAIVVFFSVLYFFAFDFNKTIFYTIYSIIVLELIEELLLNIFKTGEKRKTIL